MTTTKAHVTLVRKFEEKSNGGPPRRHVLAIYDNGQVRVLIDRVEHMATRLLTTLNDGQEHAQLDGPPQIKALCDEYVRLHTREGERLACRLTHEHLTSPRRRRGADDAGLAFAA
jgi:hypothetical protein